MSKQLPPVTWVVNERNGIAVAGDSITLVGFKDTTTGEALCKKEDFCHSQARSTTSTIRKTQFVLKRRGVAGTTIILTIMRHQVIMPILTTACASLVIFLWAHLGAFVPANTTVSCESLL